MAEVRMEDLKPNSHQYQKEQERAQEEGRDIPVEKNVEAVVSGKVTRKKKSLGRRFVEIFFADGESIQDIRTYLVEEVLVPAIKENIADAINGAVGMLFFGEARRRSGKSSRNGSRVNYGGYFNSDDGGTRRERISRASRDRSSRASLDEFLFESRADAEQVRDEMLEMLDQYDQVTVADYLDLIGVSSEFTDHKYGWTDLGRMPIARGRGGYRLELPREIALGR